MTDLDRRSFLKTTAGATVGAAVLGGPFAGFPRAAWADRGDTPSRALRDVPDMRDGVVRLALPAGFNYRSFHDTSVPGGVTLDDGARLPGAHDGMGAFGGPGNRVTLIRNHELNGPGAAFGPSGSPTYDPAARGGTTTVHASRQGDVAHAFTSLSGTQMNCSGGQMPWGSWVTCEETVNGPDVGNDFTGQNNSLLAKPHGLIFEVPVDGVASAVPVTMAGRFPHEAVSFDPVGGALYLTEDNFGFPSGFYKYVPPQNPVTAGRLMDGGTLWMLRVVGTPNADLWLHQAPGTTYAVDWVEIDEPYFDYGTTLTLTQDQALQFVSSQGLAQGAAKFSRLEGSVYEGGVVYFASTQGGATPAGHAPPSGFGDGYGQVWAYDARASTLHLVFESPSKDVLDFPDNVTTSPRGTLVLCEDRSEGNYLRGLTRDGQIFDIARNAIAGRENDEFAGSTFSQDGHTLFVNIQASNGMTFAIWGPWASIGV